MRQSNEPDFCFACLRTSLALIILPSQRRVRSLRRLLQPTSKLCAVMRLLFETTGGEPSSFRVLYQNNIFSTVLACAPTRQAFLVHCACWETHEWYHEVDFYGDGMTGRIRIPFSFSVLRALVVTAIVGSLGAACVDSPAGPRIEFVDANRGPTENDASSSFLNQVVEPTHVELAGQGFAAVCSECHGDSTSPAPPLSVESASDTTVRGVGAHRSHLQATDWHATGVCADCHIVPKDVEDVGHIDSTLPADVFFGEIAQAEGSDPTWGGERCQNVYCHGATLNGDLTEPSWTTVDGSQAYCGSCHALPPELPHDQSAGCPNCHTPINASFAFVRPEDHINGIVDVRPFACDTCHGSDGNPAPPADTAGNWSSTERTVGAHRSHVGSSDWRATISCEQCHTVPDHMDSPGHRDDGSPAELTFGDMATSHGASPSFDGERCVDAYCHGSRMMTPGEVDQPIWTVVDDSQAFCGACHGLPPGGYHPQSYDCSSCHPNIAEDWSFPSPETHINGEVELVDMACDSCHGSDGISAPPVDVSGNSETSERGVGAHRAHVEDSGWRVSIGCEECHLEPEQLDSPGHFDTALPAELVFGVIATADGAEPEFDGVTCNDTYCHGTTLNAGGEHTEPSWTVTDGSEAYCGSCHMIPPPAPHSPSSSCGDCHITAEEGSFLPSPELHVNGEVDGDFECGSCHSVPPDNGAHARHFGDASSPPLATYGDLRALESYYDGGSPVYMFGCGNCHPLDDALHGDGETQIELYNPAAPEGTIKALQPASAAYEADTCVDVYCHSTGQDNAVFVETPTWSSGTIAGEGRCSSCHGNPPAYIPDLEEFQEPECVAACDSDPTCIEACPLQLDTRPEASLHLVMGDDGWEFGHFGSLPGPWNHWFPYHGIGEDDYWGTVMASPFTCQLCHYDTVDPTHTGSGDFYYIDTSGDYDLGGLLGYSCTSCHTDDESTPETATGAIVPLRHVNGVRDVVFDPRDEFPARDYMPLNGEGSPIAPMYPHWVSADATVGPLCWTPELGTTGTCPVDPDCVTGCASDPTCISGCGVDPDCECREGNIPPDSHMEDGFWSFTLRNSTWDAERRTCENVPCHLAQSYGSEPREVDGRVWFGFETFDPMSWGTAPVGYTSSCNACHQY